MKQLRIPADGRITTTLDQNPWNSPACARVQCAIGHSTTVLHLRFEVDEKSCRAVTTTIGGPVWRDSCVELFIAFDKSRYYNLECNCIGTIHAACGAQREGRQQLEKGIVQNIRTTPSLGRKPVDFTGPTVWSVELEIPLATFCHDRLKSLSGVMAWGNLYKCGDDLQQPHWLSWSPIETPRPDFHRPEFFGELRFEDTLS